MIKIKAIRHIGKSDVYNMEVEKHHNFSVNGGLIVHNCRYAVMSRPPISKNEKYSFPDDMSLSEQSAVLNNIAFEKEYEKLQEHIVGF